MGNKSNGNQNLKELSNQPQSELSHLSCQKVKEISWIPINSNHYLETLILSILWYEGLKQTSYKILLKEIVIPFFQEAQRELKQGDQFRIQNYEFTVIGMNQGIEGIIGKNTLIYLYECYQNEPIKQTLVYTQKNGIEKDIQHFLITQQLQVIKDTFITFNHQDIQILNCGSKTSGKVTQQTKIKIVQNVKRLKKATFWIQQNTKQLQEIIIQHNFIEPYFFGMMRYVECGQIIYIDDMKFEIQTDEQNGFIISGYTQLKIELMKGIKMINPLNQNNNTQLQQQTNQNQIDQLHQLLNTFIQLSEQQQIQQSGAEEYQISKLPTHKITISNFNNEDNNKCYICYQDYEQDNIVKTMPCMHYFHEECIDIWLHKSKLCPLCKNSL